MCVRAEVASTQGDRSRSVTYNHRRGTSSDSGVMRAHQLRTERR